MEKQSITATVHYNMYIHILNTVLLHSVTKIIIVPSNDMQVAFCKNTGISCTVYNTLPSIVSTNAHTSSMCRECSKPKARQGPYTRHSPDADTISQYLSEKAGFKTVTTAKDTLCKSCYNTHLVILEHIDQSRLMQHVTYTSNITL